MKSTISSILFSLFFLLLTATSYSQNVTWQRMYDSGMNMDDEGHDVCESTDGNFYVIGFARVPYIYFYVLKINPYGDTIWTKLVVPGGIGLSIAPSNDGGCVLAGISDSSFTMKLDSSGNQVWRKVYRNLDTRILDLDKTSDGGYIGCGYIQNAYGYLLKIDSMGEKQWDTIVVSNTTKAFFSVTEDSSDGGFLVLSDYRELYPQLYYNLIKFNESGHVDWERIHRYDSLRGAPVTIEKINDGYILFGSSQFSSSSRVQNIDYHIFFRKVDKNGLLKNYAVVRTKFSEIFYSANVINENRFVYCSFYQPAIYEDSTICYFRIIDSTGNILHEKKLMQDKGRFYLAESILPLQNGNIFFAGYAELFPSAQNSQIFAAITDSNLYMKPVLISNQDIILNDFYLFQNYPNPFNGKTIIKFNIKKMDNYSLVVYDITGKKIDLLFNKIFSPGNYEFNYDAGFLSSGIYFYVLKSSNFNSVKLLNLIK